jgi:putative DNA primase/helicase
VGPRLARAAEDDLRRRQEPKGWQNLRIGEADAPRYFNGAPQNVGVILGEASGDLVDADLDCPEAVDLAAWFLPPTEVVFGRAGKPRSHRIYTSRVPKRVELVDPENGECLLELRSTGGQTVFPGSVHPSGEPIEWHEDGDPAPVDPGNLLAAFHRLGAACLLLRHDPGKGRHLFFRVVSGWLLRSGWPPEAVRHLLAPVARVRLADRGGQAEDEIRRLCSPAEGVALPGFPSLVEHVGERRARKLAEWLGAEGAAGSGGSSRPGGAEAKPGACWRDPAPLPAGLPAVEPFDLLLLPDRLRPWVADVAERMQVPADFPAVAAVVGLGAVVGRQVGIRPKRHDDWTVVPNLWGGIVGRPGLLKTPSLQEVVRPLVGLETAAKEAFERRKEEHDLKQQIARQQKKLRDDKISKDLKAGLDREGILGKLKADGEGGEDEPPARRRYLVNDSTIEKLGEILDHNPRGALVFRDELTGFLRQMDRDGHEQDRAFYLEAWNGTGRFTYDRIGRGTVDIEACCVSLLGGIQPGPLTAYLEGMAHGGAGDDGLIQRLQLVVWPDPGGSWRNVDRAPDLAARQAAVELYERLDRLPALPAGPEPGHGGELRHLRFDDEAQEAFDAWRAGLEARLRDGSLHPAFEAHLAKYRSLVPSLALLGHLADVGAGRPVGIVALERALAWAEYLESHARRLYDTVIRGDLCAARALGERLQNGDLGPSFALREVYRAGWAGLASREAAAAAVGVLVDLDWLRAEEVPAGPAGGRPTARYQVNPKLGAAR